MKVKAENICIAKTWITEKLSPPIVKIYFHQIHKSRWSEISRLWARMERQHYICHFIFTDIWFGWNIFTQTAQFVTKFNSQKKTLWYAVKKTTTLFGNFSQTSDPPPLWEPLIQKKILLFILHFRPLGRFFVFTKKLKFCQYFYIYFWEKGTPPLPDLPNSQNSLFFSGMNKSNEL